MIIRVSHVLVVGSAILMDGWFMLSYRWIRCVNTPMKIVQIILLNIGWYMLINPCFQPLIHSTYVVSIIMSIEIMNDRTNFGRELEYLFGLILTLVEWMDWQIDNGILYPQKSTEQTWYEHCQSIVYANRQNISAG